MYKNTKLLSLRVSSNHRTLLEQEEKVRLYRVMKDLSKFPEI